MVETQVVRRYRLYLPRSYNESNSNPVPLLLDFHGCSLLISINPIFQIHNTILSTTVAVGQQLSPINHDNQSTIITNQQQSHHCNSRFTNYHPCSCAVGEVKRLPIITSILLCSWGGSPSGQESNFRQLAEEEGFLLVSAINLIFPEKQHRQTIKCSP